MAGVMFERYLEPFWLQAWVPGPDGFGGVEYGWGDGERLMGIFVQKNDAEMRMAEAQGLAVQGDFVTDIDAVLGHQDVLRRESDDMYFRITGLPQKSPEQAGSKFQIVAAEKTEKPV